MTATSAAETSYQVGFSSSSHYASSYPYSSAAASAASAAAASSVASFPRARSSSPSIQHSDSPHYSSSAAASGPVSSDEYPACVQELVMNGFQLSKVLHAYHLIGDSFDDLLSFLLSSTS